MPSLVVGTLLLLGAISASAGAAERPNILWLVSEDNTTLLGCYGDRVARTPALDKLAREGVVFERCFTQPVCAPSRFSLITGLPPTSSGPAHHMRAQGRIPAGAKGFPALLRQAGYFTANNAKTDYNTALNLKETWNENGRKAHYCNRPNPAQPFFSVFNHEITHESCLFPEEDVSLGFEPTDPVSVRVPPYLPDTPEIRADIARFYDHLVLMDRQVGAELKELEEAGLAENTIVFYYGDNGGAVPRSKRFLQRSGTQVPLIVRFPLKWRHLAPAPAGSRLTQPVSFADFAPTVLSLAGVRVPDYMVGRPFTGPGARTNTFVFCTRDRMDERYDMMRSVVDYRWLYIRNFRPDLPYVQRLEYQFRARGYQSWARMAAAGKLTPATAQFWGEKPTEELYDLVSDPDNVTNLAMSPAHEATLARMRAALKHRTLQVRDNGFLPEGSALEGYNSSRGSAYPVETVFEMACLASARDPDHLPQFTKGLEHESEPVRWWAAQGCTILGQRAALAAPQLERSLNDPSGPVQVAAAEALAQQGKSALALPVLSRWLACETNRTVALQAANVLDRLGEKARPALPEMRMLLARLAVETGGNQMESYIQRILQSTLESLEESSPRRQSLPEKHKKKGNPRRP